MQRNDFLPEGLGRSGQTISATVPAGETRQFNVAGSQFYFYECDGVLWVKTDQSSPSPNTVGKGQNIPQGSYFKWIECDNRSAVDVDIEMYAGFGDVIDTRLNIVRERPLQIQPVTEARAEADGAGITSIATVTAIVYAPVLTGNRIQRKSITISNLDTVEVLHIRDAAGAVIGVIFPQTAQVYFVSEEVQIYNPALGAVNCFVGEIYYIDN